MVAFLLLAACVKQRELLWREGSEALLKRLQNSCSNGVKLISVLHVLATVVSNTVQVLKEDSNNEDFPISRPKVFCHFVIKFCKICQICDSCPYWVLHLQLILQQTVALGTVSLRICVRWQFFHCNSDIGICMGWTVVITCEKSLWIFQKWECSAIFCL